MINCFHFTYEELKKRGLNIPSEWNNFSYAKECIKIKDDPKYYLDNNLHFEYFKSFTKVVDTASLNDIIIHSRGIGIALDKKRFMTIGHIGNIIVKPITKHYKILRVKNG